MANPVYSGIEDYKDSDGKWVCRKQVNLVRYVTYLGRLYLNMKSRCRENGSMQKDDVSYVGVKCLFTDFQDFANWAVAQKGYGEDGFQLDKDIKDKSKRVYSKETCAFVPNSINTLLNDNPKLRGKLMVGVQRDGNMYSSWCSIENKQVFLGNFKTELDAFCMYKWFKEAVVKQQAHKWKDKIDPEVFSKLLSYEVQVPHE